MEADLPAAVDAAAALAASERASLGELEAAMYALAEGLDGVPVPTPEVLTREAIRGHRGWCPGCWS